MMYLSLARMCKQVYFIGVYMCTHACVNLCMIVGMEITVLSMCVHLSVCASVSVCELFRVHKVQKAEIEMTHG